MLLLFPVVKMGSKCYIWIWTFHLKIWTHFWFQSRLFTLSENGGDIWIWTLHLKIWTHFWFQSQLFTLSENGGDIWIWTLHLKIWTHFWFQSQLFTLSENGGDIWSQCALPLTSWPNCSLHLKTWPNYNDHFEWALTEDIDQTILILDVLSLTILKGGYIFSVHFIWKLGLFILHMKDLMNNNSMTQ